VFGVLDRAGAAYSVLAGNHDVPGGTTDQRGRTPYLDAFGPRRFARSRSFGGASPDGYNTFHTFRAAGREWLVLALDWRPSDAGIAWARKTIADHPHCPVILTTHEIVGSYDDGTAGFSDFGQRLWDQLIKDNDQIFLTLNGHYWPAGRTVRANAAGHDVHLHITNYQNRYYGGAAMIRLYHFDLVRNVIDVETVSPWIMRQPVGHRNLLAAQEVELSTDRDYFSLPMDFASRFAGFAPVTGRPARPAKEMLIRGTVAYWRFDGHGGGSPAGPAPDLSGHRNDLTQVQTVPGTPAGALTYTAEHHPDQPCHGSLRHRRPEPRGARHVPADRVRCPPERGDLRQGLHVRGLLQDPGRLRRQRQLLGGDAVTGRLGRRRRQDLRLPGGTAHDPVTVRRPGAPVERVPAQPAGPVDELGHELPLNQWWHVAVVNDGRHTVLYVDGCPLVRNPSTPAIGLTTLNKHWLLGGHEDGGKVDQVFNGWLGDVRIANRPLRVDEFMNA
jgi:hypothetical protein